MHQFNKKVGARGEEEAVKLLLKKGYQILERNFHTRFGEIDIVAKSPLAHPRGVIIIFVEVKTKSGDQYGEPWEMINKRKLQQVKNMAVVYLTKNGLGEVSCQIDVIGVWLTNGKVNKIEHWQGVDLD